MRKRSAVIVGLIATGVWLVSCIETTGDTSRCECNFQTGFEVDKLGCGSQTCHRDRLWFCPAGNEEAKDIGPCPDTRPPATPAPDSGLFDSAVADAKPITDAKPADTYVPPSCPMQICQHNVDCADAGVGSNVVCLEVADAFRTRRCFNSDAVQKTCAAQTGTSPVLYRCQGDSADRAAACVPAACTATQTPRTTQDQPCN